MFGGRELTLFRQLAAKPSFLPLAEMTSRVGALLSGIIADELLKGIGKGCR
jgi:hypothetical protein